MALNCAHVFDRDLVNISPRDRRTSIIAMESNASRAAMSPAYIRNSLVSHGANKAENSPI